MKTALRQFALGLGLGLPMALAHAAIAPPSSGNGELFLNVHDIVNRVSYTLDLGITMNDFFIETQQNIGYQRFWVVDSPNFTSFLTQISNPATLDWSVVAVDSTGNNQPGNQRLFTTVRQGQEAAVASMTNANLSLATTAPATVSAIDIFNTQGTHGVTGTPVNSATNGDHIGLATATAPTNLGYYGLAGGLTPTYNNTAPFSATNRVGQSSWFYYLTRSSTQNLSTSRVLVDEFDNGNPTDGGRDGYWGFIQANNPATTLPEWQGKYLLSFSMPVFSTLLLASTQQFAANIGRTEYSGGFFTQNVSGLSGSGLEGASSASLESLSLVASAQLGDPGLPVLLSPVPEAQTWLLWALGLTGLAWTRHARRGARRTAFRG